MDVVLLERSARSYKYEGRKNKKFPAVVEVETRPKQ
jgi:hypothetical protein